MTDKYTFKPYNPAFPSLFASEAVRIKKVLSEVRVEHMGSTAVPGLGGKGSIDMYVVAPLGRFQDAVAEIEPLGYIRREGVGDEERLFLRKATPERDFHIHLVPPDSADLRRGLAFRDWLRTHPEDVELYAEAKRYAAEAAEGDKDRYMALKETVMADILQRAMEGDQGIS